MKILVSHPTGNRNVRAVIESFFRSSLLAEFATTIATDEDSAMLRLLPSSLQKELLRRSFPIPEQFIWSHPLLEFMRMILPKFGLSSFTSHEKSWAGIDKVYRDFDKAVSRRLLSHYNKGNITSVYAYEDGAFATFTRARELGLTTIYDLPIAYWETMRTLLLEEADRLPQWKNTLGGGIYNSKEKLNRKTKELEQADIVVCPGEFVSESIPAWAKQKKIIVAPFGSPSLAPSTIEGDKHIIKPKNRPLRVLFAGSMGQRKGLADLFAAMKLLHTPNIELIVMGSLLETMDFYKKGLPNFTYEPGRPHEEVLALMRSCDVFCLPSIVEGRALVIQEAMSQGLPIIITRNSGGADLVIEGKTGFLIPVGNSEAIARIIDWFAQNRDAAIEMGEAAREHASAYTWEGYGLRIIEELKNFKA